MVPEIQGPPESPQDILAHMSLPITRQIRGFQDFREYIQNMFWPLFRCPPKTLKNLFPPPKNNEKQSLQLFLNAFLNVLLSNILGGAT